MVKNPMQKKAQVSFLLGMLITLFVTGIVIAVLIFLLTKTQNKVNDLTGKRTTVCVLKSDVKSGQVITDDLVTTIQVDSRTIPTNSFGSDVSIINTYRLEDTRGNSLVNDTDGNLCAPYYNDITGEIITDQSGKVQYKIVETTDGTNYYYQDTGKKIELKTVPVIAKVDIKANTVITSSLIVRSDEKVTDDIRRAEYNMILLPTQLESGKYVDIRLRLPNGANYVVVSHKEIEIPNVDGTDSLTTIAMNLNEIEILTLSGAIVDAYRMEGAYLYAVEYVEPGLQEKATPTYVPSNTIISLITADENCVSEAKRALWERLYELDGNGNPTKVKTEQSNNRKTIDSALQQNSEEAEENLKTKVQEEIQAIQEERQKYLESLGG